MVGYGISKTPRANRAWQVSVGVVVGIVVLTVGAFLLSPEKSGTGEAWFLLIPVIVALSYAFASIDGTSTLGKPFLGKASVVLSSLSLILVLVPILAISIGSLSAVLEEENRKQRSSEPPLFLINKDYDETYERPVPSELRIEFEEGKLLNIPFHAELPTLEESGIDFTIELLDQQGTQVAFGDDPPLINITLPRGLHTLKLGIFDPTSLSDDAPSSYFEVGLVLDNVFEKLGLGGGTPDDTAVAAAAAADMSATLVKVKLRLLAGADAEKIALEDADQAVEAATEAEKSVDELLESYESALAEDYSGDKSAEEWYRTCREGTLDTSVTTFETDIACAIAAALEPTEARYVVMQGINAARNEDYDEARFRFETVLDPELNMDTFPLSHEEIRSWVDSLRREGDHPFKPEVLEALRARYEGQ